MIESDLEKTIDNNKLMTKKHTLEETQDNDNVIIDNGIENNNDLKISINYVMRELYGFKKV